MTYKEKIEKDIAEGKIINNKGPDKRTNSHWRIRYYNLLERNREMRIKLDEYEKRLGIEKEELGRRLQPLR